jgi:hypothetical protein
VAAHGEVLPVSRSCYPHWGGGQDLVKAVMA